MLAEVTNVMFWKKKFGKEQILEFVEVLSDGKIGFVALDRFVTSDLLEVMERKKVTVYDAYYLILAKKHNCRLMSFDETPPILRSGFSAKGDKKLTDIIR